VNYGTLSKHGYSFEKLKELYKDKYGEEIKANTRWDNISNRGMLSMFLNVMRENDLNSAIAYDEWRKGNKDYPSLGTIKKRLNMTYAELNKLVKALK
jgi:hypothetical protein